jgi:hypothetical protein
MAKTESRAAKKQGETIQIIILTLFMTAGFFGLFTLVLVLWMPSKDTQVLAQINDLDLLRKEIVPNGERWKQRAQIEALRKSGVDVNLREVISTVLQGLVPNRFPELQKRPVAPRSKTTVSIQELRLTGLPLVEIFQFLGRVKMANEAIHIEGANFTRSRSRPGEGELWDASLTFHYYENQDVKAELQRHAKAAEQSAKAEGAKEEGKDAAVDETKEGGQGKDAGQKPQEPSKPAAEAKDGAKGS